MAKNQPGNSIKTPILLFQYDNQPDMDGNAAEGVIKFTCHWEPGPALSITALKDIIFWRSKCFALGWIGCGADGIGYGNISQRRASHQFVISGSATGCLQEVTPAHFTEVKACQIASNQVTCQGPIQASSETMTHGALYQVMPAIQVVIHIHQGALWQRVLHQIPTTAQDIPYGTPDMAKAIQQLAQKKRNPFGVFAMAGHQDGLIAYGRHFREAFQQFFSLFLK